MPQAFITSKTEEVVSLQLGGEIDGMFVDGEVEIRKGETFFDWSFEDLQTEIATTIIYTDLSEDEE